MRVALIGQSAFGADVYKEIKSRGHEIVAVFTIPDGNGKEDPIATVAKEDGVTVFKYSRWKLVQKEGGHVLESVWQDYQKVQADVNVLAFVTQFIPMEVINYPKHGSIVYHPSILPRHRGASAINWTLMEGDKKGGFTIFYADDGLDTGDILLQREVDIDDDDNVNSLYKRFLYPEGVKAMGEAVDLIASGKATRTKQPEEGATYDKMWKNRELAKINWNVESKKLHDFIRGNDKVPGAWTNLHFVEGGEVVTREVTFYGSTMKTNRTTEKGADDKEAWVDGLEKRFYVCQDGLVIWGIDNVPVLISQLKINGRILAANTLGSTDQALGGLGELSAEDKETVDKLRETWKSILQRDAIEEGDDFFGLGGGSMDVTRLVATVKDSLKLELEAEEVYMATVFSAFAKLVLNKKIGKDEAKHQIQKVWLEVNDMKVSFPTQLFINGEFVDASDNATFDTVNPATEEVICKVAKGTEKDVDKAVLSASAAFEEKWKRMNARDRGTLLYKLADIMDAHREELATIESIDSGAVYTLALKTHVGMSIDTFRYFAGWCDKIQGATIPINNARPNRNLCFTRREPIGVCGLIVPWNYPLMMLAWKMAAALAAGNTVVIKPAGVTPLTSLKFAELTVLAGFPKGVVNVVPGGGTVVGNRIAEHPLIRKVGFTGSTPVGRTIMESASKNVKKCSLELGGKSPLLIFGDCNIEKAVRGTLGAVFFNKGENCIAAGRIFVDASIYDDFLNRVVVEVKKMKIGDPLDRSTDHGPQNHKAHLDKLLEYVERGVKEGARLVYGGKRVNRKGFFMEPTILADVKDESYIAEEESFGPVMIISKFDSKDLDGVLVRANNTEYGLCAGVYTNDINKALYCSENLAAGTVFVNTYNKTDVAAPFGGFKQSGYGKDLGEEALNEYLKTKTVTIEY